MYRCTLIIKTNTFPFDVRFPIVAFVKRQKDHLGLLFNYMERVKNLKVACSERVINYNPFDMMASQRLIMLTGSGLICITLDNYVIDTVLLYINIMYFGKKRHYSSLYSSIHGSTTWPSSKRGKLYSYNVSRVMSIIYADRSILDSIVFKITHC